MGKLEEIEALSDEALAAKIEDCWKRIKAAMYEDSGECEVDVHLELFDYEDERDSRNPEENEEV